MILSLVVWKVQLPQKLLFSKFSFPFPALLLAYFPSYGAYNYPVLAYFHHGESQPEKLENNPTLEQMVKFVNEHSGLHRTVNGTLEPTAGHVKAINDLISQVANIDVAFVEQLGELIKSLQQDTENEYNMSHCSWYQSYGQKIAERGWKYAQNELERLENMISNSSKMSPKKKTELMYRVNILQAYFKYFRHTYATLD